MMPFAVGLSAKKTHGKSMCRCLKPHSINGDDLISRVLKGSTTEGTMQCKKIEMRKAEKVGRIKKKKNNNNGDALKWKCFDGVKL